MNRCFERRRFLQLTGAVTLGLGPLRPTSAATANSRVTSGAPQAERLGWRLGCQAYSFNRYTFFEAIEKVQALGLHWIEAYPGQRLSADQSDVQIGAALPAAVRTELRKRLADAGVRLVNYGVCPLWPDEAASRPTFDFAAEMGIETIVSEPPLDAFDTVEKLCDEYQMNVAIHNHPQPSRYWNPATVLKVCQGRSKRLGACADTGHWMRSQLNPTEQLRQLEGRLITFHFKDLNTFGKEAHDVPWGTGQGDVRAMLREIHRQGVRAVFSIEYEHNWTSSIPEIAQCVGYFNQIAAELAGPA